MTQANIVDAAANKQRSRKKGKGSDRGADGGERQGGTETGTDRKKAAQRLKQLLVVKGQCFCDKACLDSMLTASCRVLVNMRPVHFTGHNTLCTAHKDSLTVKRLS